MYIFEVASFFFSTSGYPINSILSGSRCLYKIHVFDEAFFLLTIRMALVTKLVRVVISR